MRIAELLLVMARAPIAGQCKTRLAATIGDAPARDLYEAMLRDTWAAATATHTVVKLCSEGSHAVLDALAPTSSSSRWQQPDGSLGARMATLLRRGLEEAEAVCLIGSDAPTVSRDDLELAFELLAVHPAVIGPATDGGFWLIGLTEPRLLAGGTLFEGVRLSTPSALADLLPRLPGAALLPVRDDVDELADLERLHRSLDAAGAPAELAPHCRALLPNLVA